MKENEKKDDLDLFLPTQADYKPIQNKESVVDIQSGVVTNIRKLQPMEQLRVASQRANITLNEKPKSNCKHCYERGYIGYNPDKSPIICRCMFPKETEEQAKENKGKVPLHCLPKKVQRRYIREKKKELRKAIDKESTMRDIRMLKEKVVKEAKDRLIERGDIEDISGTTDVMPDGQIQKESEDKNVDKG